MKRSDMAVETLASGLNCAQSVLAAFTEDLDLERNDALRLASGFGSGMGRMAGTCGAVTGAFMVIGLKIGNISGKDKDAKDRTYALIREFAAQFAKERGSLVCRELLGCDISTQEGLNLANAKDLYRTICPKCVESSVTILEKILEKHGKQL